MGKGKVKICRGVPDGQLAERVEGVRSRHRRRAGFPEPASLKSRCLGCANRAFPEERAARAALRVR